MNFYHRHPSFESDFGQIFARILPQNRSDGQLRVFAEAAILNQYIYMYVLFMPSLQRCILPRTYHNGVYLYLYV